MNNEEKITLAMFIGICGLIAVMSWFSSSALVP